MANQATVEARNPNQTRSNGSSSGAAGVVGSIAEFGNDIATLAELQLKLAALDFKDSSERALMPLALTLVGAVVALGAVPVLLAAIAVLLASAFQVGLGWMLLLVSIVALAAAGGLAASAGIRLGRSFLIFRRSREELVRNVSWVRTVLVHSGRAAPRRQV